MPEYYEYRKPRTKKPVFTADRIKKVGGKEQLTGAVKGEPASDIEERLANALSANGVGYEFTVDFKTPFSVPGQPNNIDYLLYPRKQYVEVYGEIGHGGAGEKGKDIVREAWINSELQKQGLPKLQVVWYYDLQDADQANAVVKERFA